MCQRVQIDFCQDPKSGINFCLEWQGKCDVEVIVPSPLGIRTEEHVESCNFEERAQGPRERSHERIEYEQFP
jgi:hypothetical protein